MKLTSDATILDFDPYVERTEAGATHNIGEGVSCADGRKFRYAVAGEAITKGYLAVAPSPDTAYHTLAVTSAAAIGATQIVFTGGASTSTAGEYNEGYAVISYGTGIGSIYQIKYSPVMTSVQTGITIDLWDPIKVALDTTSKLDLVHNNYNGVQMTTSTTVNPAGVSLSGMTASGDFGWLQTRGICPVYSDDTIAVGTIAVADGSVSGGIDGVSETIGTTVAQQFIGRAIVASVQAYTHPVFLQIE